MGARASGLFRSPEVAASDLAREKKEKRKEEEKEEERRKKKRKGEEEKRGREKRERKKMRLGFCRVSNPDYIVFDFMRNFVKT